MITLNSYPENLLILAREGEAALKQKLPHLWRDYTTLKLHQLWESDGRKADVFCRWPDGTVRRPFVVAWREVRTRVVLSVRIYPYANGEIVMESFESALRRANTIPDGCILDNGREYANKPFTGGQKTRYRFVVKNNEPIGALTRLGCKVHWTTPYHGAAKPIESWWGNMAKNVDCRFPRAYTGRNSVERPENCDPDHAIPIETFAHRLIQAVQKFHHTIHGGQGMFGKTPLELYEELSKEYQPNKPTKLQLAAMRPYAFHVKLRQQYYFEFKLKGFGKVRYEPPQELNLRRGVVEYDVLPDNSDPKAPALIFEGHKYLGEAVYKGHTDFLDNEAGGEVIQSRNSTVKKTRKKLKAIKGEQNALQHQQLHQNHSGLPDLPQSPLLEVLKQPKVKPLEPEKTIQKLDDGNLLDTTTGEIHQRIVPAETSATNLDGIDQEELERKREEIRKKDISKWKSGTDETDHSGGFQNDPDIPNQKRFKE